MTRLATQNTMKKQKTELKNSSIITVKCHIGINNIYNEHSYLYTLLSYINGDLEQHYTISTYIVVY